MIRKATQVLLAALVMLAAACSGSAGESSAGPERDPAASAVLDRTKGSFRLPLDDFRVGPVELQLGREARAVIQGDCVRAAGLPFDLDQNVSVEPVIDDRTYGFWVREFVEAHGIAGPNRSDTPQLPEDPADRAIWEGCADKAVNELDTTSVQWGEGFPVIQEIAAVANTAAESDSEWQEVLAEFETCVEAEGLSVMVDFPYAVDTSGSDEAETIRRLLADVACKDSSNMIQRLTDIIAQYQAPLIQQRMAELAEPKRVRDELMDKAQAILATR